MPSHFSNIGFTVGTREDLAAFALQAAQKGTETQTELGFYLCWSPGAGVQLWTQADPSRRLMGCNPHFAGTSRIEVAVTAALPDAEHQLDGSFHVWAEPGDSLDKGAYPFIFDAPNFEIAAQNSTYPRRAVVQVAAFAEDLTCYADEDAYDQTQAAEPGLGAESFVPTGLFVQEGERPRAAALFTGRILEAERRINPVTITEFYWLSVRTLGGVYDVVADLAFVPEPPRIGGIVQGSFWLSGRLLTSKTT